MAEVKEWMLRNHLKMNDSKTEFVIFGSNIQLGKLRSSSITIGDTQIQSSASARNIGAIFDETLSMKEQVNATCRACYFHLRNLSKVRDSLTMDAATSLVHAFISSKLDYLNALLFGIPQYLLKKLQNIQNNSARIITRRKRREHITPILKNLHWLTIEKRTEFKINLMTFKALTGLAPGYIHDMLQPYQPPRALRSLNLALLRQPRSRTKSFGDRAYATVAPRLWNRLPRHLRMCVDLDAFKSSLKAHYYRMLYMD